MQEPKNLAILGSTGSIGCNTLKVAQELSHIRVWALSGYSNLQLLQEQALALRPDRVVAACSQTAAEFKFDLGLRERLRTGPDALIEVAEDPAVDIVVAAIVGQAGLASTLAAVRAGKRVALANKEALVVAGDLMTRAARDSRAELVPVDSEHSAIWQSALAGDAKEIRRVILTASGGPFRNFSAEQLAQVTVAEALDHPNWEMGQKITIDSATMINKALEMIEAKWLFGLRPDQIEVMIHPQSIVHSLVEFVDGSVIAQLSPPDMKLPIQYALTYPHRVPGIAERIDWSSAWRLEFFPPNSLQQAALDLGRYVCENTGTCGAVLNAANEIAVAAFLAERISFNEIVPRCREILEQHKTITSPTYEQLIAADEWARQEMNKWIFA
ncbi:MAG: 1-deoxy-D-xylulose-5-phosphate reductoisomerase [Pirellulaceae bacterium]